MSEVNVKMKTKIITTTSSEIYILFSMFFDHFDVQSFECIASIV